MSSEPHPRPLRTDTRLTGTPTDPNELVMATPLATLLTGLRTDPALRSAFEEQPTEFLIEHGWQDLDPADMAEAMLVFADATPPLESAEWSEGADVFSSLDGTGAEATAAGLSNALATFADDPALLDGPHLDDSHLDTGPLDTDELDADPLTHAVEAGNEAEAATTDADATERQDVAGEPQTASAAHGNLHDDPDVLDIGSDSGIGSGSEPSSGEFSFDAPSATETGRLDVEFGTGGEAPTEHAAAIDSSLHDGPAVDSPPVDSPAFESHAFDEQPFEEQPFEDVGIAPEPSPESFADDSTIADEHPSTTDPGDDDWSQIGE